MCSAPSTAKPQEHRSDVECRSISCATRESTTALISFDSAPNGSSILERVDTNEVVLRDGRDRKAQTLGQMPLAPRWDYQEDALVRSPLVRSTYGRPVAGDWLTDLRSGRRSA